MKDIEILENKLLSGNLTVSEISDEKCRAVLQRFVRRHRKALTQLEGQLRADEQSIRKLEVTECKTTKELSSSEN